MTDTVTITLIGAVFSFFTAALSVVSAYINTRIKKDVKETKDAIVTLEKNTNSIKDDLVALTRKSSHAEGKLEGRAELKDEIRQENGGT